MLQCKNCGNYYLQWNDMNDLCPACNEKAWERWEVEHADELKQIEDLQKKGHSRHCACRQVWGDGECECDLYEKGYDPYGWLKKLAIQ